MVITYIAHIKSGGKWITCNDSNISESFDEMCGRSRNNYYYYLYSKIIKPRSAIHLCGEWQELKGRTWPVGPYDKFVTAGKTFVKYLNQNSSHVSPSNSKMLVSPIKKMTSLSLMTQMTI